MLGRNSTYRPALLPSVAPERKCVNRVERHVVPKIKAAVPSVRIEIVGIGNGGRSVIEAETAIRVRAVNAMRIGVSKLVNQPRRRSMRDSDLKRIVRGVTGGIGHIQRSRRPDKA